MSKTQELPQLYGRTRAQTRALRTEVASRPQRSEANVTRKTRASAKKTTPRVSQYDRGTLMVERLRKHPDYARVRDEVRDEFRDVNRKPRAFYPIYSDTPGAWQIDLMFYTMRDHRERMVRYPILNVINVNTRFAYSQVLKWNEPSNKVEGNESYTDQEEKKIIHRIPKSSSKVLEAFRDILSDIEAFNAYERTRNEAHKYSEKRQEVKTLYADDGSEFKGVFKNFCSANGIRLVQFKPKEGLKTRLGIVERLNRTIRSYLAKFWLTFQRLELRTTLQQALDVVVNDYNNHPMLSIQRLGLKNGMEIVRTPYQLSVPGLEHNIMRKKRADTAYVHSVYRDEIARLKRRENFRYFVNPAEVDHRFPFFDRSKKNSEKPKLSDSKGTYATGQHVTRAGTFQANSFKVHGTQRRVLPYDVEFLKEKIVTL